MARIKVRNGETVTTETNVALGDRLVIEAGGAIARGTVPAVRITGADAAINNAGTISVTASGAAITGALTGVLDIAIVNSGTISGTAGAVALSSVTGTTGDVRLVNAGTISGGTSQAITFKDLRASTITIVNQEGGTITNAGTADVVRPGHDLASAIKVVNAGDIIAGTVAGATSSGDGIDFQSQDGGVLGTVINRATGHIEGGKHGITGANAAVILNDAGGEIIGRNGSGLNFDTESADGDGAVRVINHGLISGRYDGFGSGDGDGVDVDYLVDIRNDGRIEGVGADNVDNFADGVAAGGGSIVNLVGGEIFGAENGILIDDGDRNGAYAATRIVNEGTISANNGYGVRLIGDFDDTIVNSGYIAGLSVAAIDAGAGDDRVINRGSIVGVIDLGDGADQYLGQDSLAGFFGGNVVNGGAGNDRIFGGAFDDRLVGGADNDKLSGGAGDDVIVGGLGTDVMMGGDGADTYVFNDIADSPLQNSPADADLIVFGAGDVIDFSAIDADPSQDGDQAFTIAPAGSTGAAPGELTIMQFGPDVFAIGLFVEGGTEPEFAILVQVSDPSTLQFVL